jgi:uncharacterized protein YcbK (DUF882 family)
MRYACLVATTGIVALVSSMIVPSSTETAVANGDTRTLNLYHSHTGESIQATFRVNGSYDQAVLEKLNYFLRDWRNNDRTRMDPRLFDVIWEAYRTAGATQPISIVSAYRSPQTNAMLRSRSHAVAEHSQHILGRAMDTTMPGMPMERIREIGMRLQRGGVGWYPSSNFVHLDVGNVRAWPRMSYDQLVRLFPDGKTVHLAADGRTLPRYEEARAEIASRGGVMADVPQAAPSGGGLFAWLFGKHDEERDEEKEAEAVTPQSARSPRTRHGGTEVASLRTNGESPADAVPASLAASTGRSAPAATAVSVQVPDKNAPRNEPNPASANRTLVADLGSVVSSRDTSAAAVEKDQNAAATSSVNVGKRWTLSSTPAPVPPQRPALPGYIALAFANTPAPPARPAALTRVATLGPDQAQSKVGAQTSKNDAMSDATAAGANTPLARAANLPVVITQGPKDRDSAVPNQVLAFASDTPEQDQAATTSRTPGQTLSHSTSQPPAARLDRSRSRALAADVAVASFQAPSILGPSFTGLRRSFPTCCRTRPPWIMSRPSMPPRQAISTLAISAERRQSPSRLRKVLSISGKAQPRFAGTEPHTG